MKKITIISMLIWSFISLAELPSWGMTEDQYKLPSFSSKMNEIGKQADKNNWLLKITAPKDWHNKIRSGLTDSGARDVQVNFKDSLYQSIAISAAVGAKMAKVSPSNGSTTVKKQVIIDKPEIDTDVEAPEFGDLEIKSNSNDLLVDIGEIDIAVPNVRSAPKEAVKPEVKAKVEAKSVAVNNAVSETAKVAQSPVGEKASVEITKEELRKRFARSKRVDKEISYNHITQKDDLFIQDDVVLVKRFVNQGVVLYFWMKEAYNPSVHKLIEKGSGKYQKDTEAVIGAIVDTTDSNANSVKEVTVTNLDFVAIDTNEDDKSDLRIGIARNKRVDTSISASQLKEDDILYVKNQTVLVVRPLTRSQNLYFWLVGDTVINREVERKGDNQFIIR